MATFTALAGTLDLERPGRPPLTIGLIDPRRAALILAERGITWTLAQDIAAGALSTADGARALAERRGLVRR